MNITGTFGSRNMNDHGEIIESGTGAFNIQLNVANNNRAVKQEGKSGNTTVSFNASRSWTGEILVITITNFLCLIFLIAHILILGGIL